jgi:sirohydrochlorin ferrochelatase
MNPPADDTLASSAPMATAMLLLVHGRSGGLVPDEWRQFSERLAERRQAPVVVHPLTAGLPSQLQNGVGLPLDPALALTLAPLLLLPGAHVRVDLPSIVGQLRAIRPGALLRRLPFVGAWPQWLDALEAERQAQGPAAAGFAAAPLLLHHPLDGLLAQRYLRLLEARTGFCCRATPYSAEHLAELRQTLRSPALPMALAANRLTDELANVVGPPLLQRARFRDCLMQVLVGQP